jgi:hypothetical protein
MISIGIAVNGMTRARNSNGSSFSTSSGFTLPAISAVPGSE